jgi:hypothetical protein
MKKTLITLIISLSIFIQFFAQAQEREVVAKILSVNLAMNKKNPPDLLIHVVGEVPTTGYSQVKLSRVNYTVPPKDSIQDYVLYAVPPEGIVEQIISEVEASDTYLNFPIAAPWMKGIRIHGIGDGIKLGDIAKYLVERERSALVEREKSGLNENYGRLFFGVSNDGSIENALSDALLKLNKALGEGGVRDAMADWELKEISGVSGGLPAYNEIRVTIEAWRNPDWMAK